MNKKLIRAIIILPLLFLFWFFMLRNYFQYPQVEIWPSWDRFHSTVIPLEDNCTFNKGELYSIEETANGYDIIVHIVKN